MSSSLTQIAKETHEKLRALYPCLTDDCVGCQTERSLIKAALLQVQQAQQEQAACIAETVDLNANGAVFGTDEIIMRIANAIRTKGLATLRSPEIP